MRTFVGAVPWSVMAMTATIIIAAVGSGVVARWLGTRRPIAALLLFGFGFVISATLMPTAGALEGGVSSGVCDLSRVGLPPLGQLTRISLTSLNVVLFVPLGVAVGLLPRNRHAGAAIVAAISLTFVVESIQLLLPVLGRGCETADMFDNLLGLGLGAALGIVARPLVRRP